MSETVYITQSTEESNLISNLTEKVRTEIVSIVPEKCLPNCRMIGELVTRTVFEICDGEQVDISLLAEELACDMNENCDGSVPYKRCNHPRDETRI